MLILNIKKSKARINYLHVDGEYVGEKSACTQVIKIIPEAYKYWETSGAIATVANSNMKKATWLNMSKKQRLEYVLSTLVDAGDSFTYEINE